MSKEDIVNQAIEATKQVKEFAKTFDGNLILEYSPECFNETEPEFSLELINSVIDVWKPTVRKKMIINLPTTVEVQTPNVFADMVEYADTHIKNRDAVILSVHPHNDRGTGIAVTELAMLAGAQRVEGTLFGNGERTGNADILTLAYNLYTQGIDPKLNLSSIKRIIATYERLCKLPVPERHPYAGKLVFTAFSGGHQDAINKGIKDMQENHKKIWHIPYLPVDPVDIGREYEPIVRINSQSGKGGVAYIMEIYHGFILPKGMHKEFADLIQSISEKCGEVDSETIMWEFKKNYIDKKEPLHFRKMHMEDISKTNDYDHTKCSLEYTAGGFEKSLVSYGNGPIDAVKSGLQKELGVNMRVLDFSEHALSQESSAQAAAYIHLCDVDTGRATYGVGISSNITRASIRALFSAINRLYFM